MPHTQHYEDVTMRCEYCAHSLFTTELAVTAQIQLQASFHCFTCRKSAGIHHYDSIASLWVNGPFVTAEPIWDVSWACGIGCEWMCRATRIELTSRFLRIAFLCFVCNGRAIRYYDLGQHGYVDVNGRILSHRFNRYAPENYTRYAGAQWERL